MAYSESKKIFWFNPIRTATRSTEKIQKFFEFTDPGLHDVPKKEHKKFFLISNVRNPYSRFVSIFYFMFRFQPKTVEDFRIFADRKIDEEKNLKNKPDFQINLSEIFDKFGKFPDYIVRVENLYDDIMGLYFVEGETNDELLTIMNDTILKNNYFQEYGVKPDWKEHYDEKTANIVYDFLKKDFELGNYHKNSWKNGTP